MRRQSAHAFPRENSLKAASLWRISILYHIQFVLKRTIKARFCSLFSHIKNHWKLLLGKIKKRPRRRFPV
jgi:hypothetical protein